MSIKDFKLVSKLGEGAYSSVYKVMRIFDGTEYALKKVKLSSLSDKEKQNALNEVRILASIRDNNIIAYKEVFIDEASSSLCIVMEYADNGDLFQKILDHQKKGQLMNENEIWNIFIQIVKGLKSLHNMKIFHRDLKSANVFLNKDGTCKLGDMNVSKIAKKGLLYTQTGTPYYASPEVWKDLPYDQKSDIWSLGCVLYEMATLKPPFRAEDMEGLYKKVTRGYYPKVPGHFSQDLNSIIRALLQVTPHLRPSCDKILQLPSVLKRIEERHLFEVDEDTPLFLNTIKFPKNLHYLTDRLPGPNYNPVKIRKVDKMKYMQTMGAKISSVDDDSMNNESSFMKKNNELPKINKKKNEKILESINPGNLLEHDSLPNINQLDVNIQKQKIKSAKRKENLQKSPIPIKEYKDYITPLKLDQSDLRSNDDKISKILAGHKQELKKLTDIPKHDVLHPNFDRQIVNIQQIYGMPSKKNKKLEKISPSKSNKKKELILDVEGESKPILSKYRKPGNIFQPDDPLSELGIGTLEKKGDPLKLPDLNLNKPNKGLKLLNIELNLKKGSQKNIENSNKVKDINKIYKSNIPNVPNIDEMKERYKIPSYKSPLRLEKNKMAKNNVVPPIS